MSIARFSELSIAQGFPKYRSALAGNAAYLPSDYESISTVLLTSAAASVTFSAIPATYKHLQIRALARSTDAGTNVQGDFYVNGVNTGAQYAFHHLETGGTSVSAVGYPDANTSYWQRIPGAGAAANVYGHFIFDFLDYASTTKYKTFRQLGGFDANGSGQIFMVSNLFKSLSAISSITFVSNTGNLAANTRFSLYGISGA